MKEESSVSRGKNQGMIPDESFSLSELVTIFT